MHLDPAASSHRYGLLALLVAAVLFAAVAPTLPWLEYSSGSENLLTATVIEMHAGGPWLIPSLNTEPRVRKPPLPAWIAAALVPRSVIADLDSPDERFRHAAYRRLAWAMRWPALLMSGIIVLVTYELGRTLVDGRFGLIACVVCASSLLLLRYGRSATTDIHLALWVTATNLCLAKAVFRHRIFPFLPLAGLAAGLAFMSKGPVGLAQSALPVVVFVGARWLLGRSHQNEERIFGGTDIPVSDSTAGPGDTDKNVCATESHYEIHEHFSRFKIFAMAIIAIIAFLAVAAPWFVYVMQTVPDAWTVFKTEVTRDGATTMAADPWHNYLVIFPMLAPWVVFFIAGLAVCALEWRNSPDKLLLTILLVAPIVIMSLVKDKNERYLLPMIAPAALLAAYAIVPQLRRWAALNPTEKWLARGHACVLMALAIGLPLAMTNARWMPRLEGGAWLTVGAAATAAVGGAVACAIAFFAWRRWPPTLIAATFLIMLMAHALFIHGYQSSLGGRSQMLGIADAIRAARPSADVYYVDTGATKAIPQDLQIYLNRAVRAVYSVDDVPEPSPGRVLVMLRRENDDPPSMPGWIELAQRPWGRRSWHALVGP